MSGKVIVQLILLLVTFFSAVIITSACLAYIALGPVDSVCRGAQVGYSFGSLTALAWLIYWCNYV